MRRLPSLVAPMVAFLGLCVAPGAVLAGPFDDSLVKVPSLTRPERGSLQGSLSQLTLGPADLARGGFSLPLPVELPSERGPALAQVLPSWSAEAGQGEWGVGWQSALRITRFRAVGELDYASDGFTSPWGELVRGDDGFYYPRGLSRIVRARFDATGAGSWTVTTGEGQTFTFRAGDAVTSPRGSYSWPLGVVTTLEGERTELTWTRNASGRSFLSSVAWGGRGAARQYQLDLVYEDLETPFDDYRAGVLETLDRRVVELRQKVRRADTGVLALRWTWKLGYTGSTTGPGFYLSQVQRTYASGELEPATTYEYDIAGLGGDPEPVPLTELDPFLAGYGATALDGGRASFVDLDDDGVSEFEHAPTLTTWRRGANGGWTSEELPVPTGREDVLCRPPAIATSNRARDFMRLGPGEVPLRVVGSVQSAGQTTFVACDRAGIELSEAHVPGLWAPGALTRLADVDRDLRPDLVRLGTGVVEVAQNIGSGDTLAFAAPVTQALTPRFAPTSAWVTDVNGDGVADVIGRARNTFVVWRGMGQRQFESDGLTMFVIGADGRRLTDISIFGVTWIDANRDGLVDLVTTRGRYVRVYVNDGWDFVEREVPALDALAFEPGMPLAVDLSGRGEHEVVLLGDSHASAVALTQASTGLLTGASDGKGNHVRFTWQRANPSPGLAARPSVLSTVELEATGQALQTWSYELEAPRMQSQSRALLGFARVTKVAAAFAETIDLHTDDDLAGVLLASTRTDGRTPSAFQFTRRSFNPRSWHGLRYWRLRSEASGWRAYEGGHELASTVDYPTYERELCPTVVTTTSRHGVLTRGTTLAHVALIPDELHCLAGSATIDGHHLDTTLDFHYAATFSRDDLGALTEVRSTGDGSSAFVLQHVDYDGEHRIQKVSQPGRGATVASFEPGTGRLTTVTAPDGVVTVSTLDPLTDVATAMSSDRGGAPWLLGFGYDGRERLARSWEPNLGTSATSPTEAYDYREAGGGKPAALRARTRLSAASTREVVTLSSSGGQKLADAVRIPEGWRISDLTRLDPGTHVADTYRRSPSATDAFALELAALYAGATAISHAETSGFDDPLLETTLVQAGVTRSVSGERRMLGDELVLTASENGTYVTRGAVDDAGRALWKEDQAGGRTRLRYDALGRLVGVTLADGQVHELRYDAHGRPAEVRRGNLGRVVYGYEPTTGLPGEKRFYDADGTLERRVVTHHDAIGRPDTESYSQPGTGATRVVHFEYDGAGAAGQRGLLTHVYGDGFDKKLVYRADGLVLQTTLVLAGWRTVEETYGYFDDGTLLAHTTRVLDTTGREVDRLDEQHGFDAYGRIDTVRFGSTTVGRFHYDAQGKLGTLDLPDGARVAYRRDATTQAVNGYTQTHAGGWTTSADWSFDARGLLASETYGFGPRTTLRSYEHDARGFLSRSVDPGHVASYTYDAAGLPLHTIDDAGDRTFVRSATKWSLGGVDYLLDRSGRVVQRGTLQVSYGPSGQIEAASDGARQWSYLVDETGARLARKVAGRFVEAWVSGGYLDDAGFVLPVLVDNRAVGVVEHGVYRSVVTDPRGTLLGEADEPMLLPTPYGQRSSHPRLARVLDFVGRGWDPDLQLSRQGVRDYDPKLGQFWQPDPLYLEALDKVAAAPVDGNLYSFAHDDPLRFADPSGLDSVGHHYVPEEVTKALTKLGLLSEEAAEVFHKTTTGWPDDVLPHQWSKAHVMYNDAVIEEAKQFARDRGITDLRKMTRAEAEAFEHYIQHQSPNVIIRGFLRFHEIVVDAAKRYKMTPAEINEIWGPMRKWLTRKGGFGSFLMEEGKNIFGKVHAGMGVMSKIPVLDIAFALWEYKELMEKLETQYQCPVEGLEKTYPIFFQWVPRDQAPPAGINWSEVPVHDESWDMHMQHDGA